MEFSDKNWDTGFIYKNKGSMQKHKAASEKLRKNPVKKNKKRQMAAAKFTLENRKDLGNFMGAKAYAEVLQMNQDIAQLNKDHKLDLSDIEDVQKRVTDFFEIMKKYSNKPTIAGLSLAMGINRSKLSDLMHGRGVYATVPPEVRELLAETYTMFESMWESYMLDGQVPSINGIFLGKNQFGYKDVVEHEVTTTIQERIDVNAIKEKYKYIGSDMDDKGLPENSTAASEDQNNADQD